MKINVIGLGYIGLPTSLILAANGNDVVGSDVNKELVAKLNRNEVTFEENGLQEVLEKAIDNNIEFTEDYSTEADMYIITVPTPYDSENIKIDSTYLVKAVKNVIKICKDEIILVVESTISPGTTDEIIRPLLEETNKKIEIVHAPERILPGSMISELVNNPRTIGADSYETAMKVKEIYSSFCKASITITDINTAEMSKVVENTYRDINIAFANELLQICNRSGLDVHEVIKIANQHPRVNVLNPGPGVGGHCISVDPWFLVSDFPEESQLIKKARDINDNMPSYVFNKLNEIMSENNIKDYSKVAIYGIAYKENVDDIRESPTLQLVEVFKNNEIEVLPKFYDPFINKNVIENQVFNEEDLIKDIEIMVLMLNHNSLMNLNIPKDVIIFDTKNTGLFNTNKKYKL